MHVALPDADTALRAFEGVVPWLPVLLALSANSPFAEGEASGLRSVAGRAAAGDADRRDAAATPRLGGVGGGDSGRRHASPWDAWPRPEHGTFEVRVMDQQTDVRRSAGFAALVQALVAAVSDAEPEPYDRELYTRRRAEAARLPPDSEEVAALAELIGPRR